MVEALVTSDVADCRVGDGDAVESRGYLDQCGHGSSVRPSTTWINVDSINVDLFTSIVHTGATATSARPKRPRLLGVERATLYAYVSRGVLNRRTAAVDGRTSLYALDELEALAQRSRGRRAAADRPTIDVQIVSGITVLDEAGPSYRGHDVAELARSASFEQVAELLWTGELPADRSTWPAPDPRRVAAASTRSPATGRDRLDQPPRA